MPMRRVQPLWQTGPGGTGLSTFYTLDSVDATVEIGAFFNTIKSLFSDQTSVTVPSNGDTLDASNGQLVGAWSGGTASTATGTTHSAYVAGTGCFVKWNTGVVVGGHRVKGRTFIAPILSADFDVTGNISSGALAVVQGAATTLAGSGKIYVWHRPKPRGATNGQMCLITSATVPNEVTSLSTRRH